ncbi:hypothetical protein ACRAQ7_03440 [Erythrobacter sp. W53]|uniref:hypothetical protein n=1 Tax=Erythrobacter sp. W53 TaxID=3425947 RepID=UPI003D76721D
MSEPGACETIRNWQRRPDGITTSGKLTAADVGALAAAGVKHVINLALDDHPEALQDEAALLSKQGIAYTHIPVPFDAPTHHHLQELENALRTSDGPAHVHCIMNYRVTAFLYLIDQKNGIAEPEARKRMTQIWDPLASDDPRAEPWKVLLTS